MKLIIGLGNPGKKYSNNRHNVGYMVVDKLKAKSLKLKDMFVVKTSSFMNDSGVAVKALVTYYKLPGTDLYIVHDDLDIPLGSYKIQFGKGPKVHRGLQSIEVALGTTDFWRVRVGIENRIKNNELRIKGEQYVLEDFTKEEKVILDKVLGKVCQEINLLLR